MFVSCNCIHITAFFVHFTISPRGGTDSWGNSRVWLDASKDTNTYGRSGFSIHGGAIPGSAGCIDLTSSMDDFTKWFENNGKDLILYVTY